MQLLDKIVNNIITNKKTNFLVFLLVLMLLTVYMMQVHSPFFAGHDFFHHWGRLNGLSLALKNGTFPWYINYNGLASTGYFVKAFYCDIPLLPFALIGLWTTPLIGYLSMVVGTTLLCGVFTYIAVYKIFRSPMVSFISGILYTFCAYRMLDLFVRAAMGEIFAFLFLPLLLWGFYEIIKGDYRKWYIVAISYSFIIFSHIISGIILIIPILLFIPFFYKDLMKDRKRLYALILAALAIIPLTAYYIFPMVEQMMSNTFYYNTRGYVFEGMAMTLKIWNIHHVLFDIPMLQSEAYAIKVGFLLTILLCIRIFVRERSNIVKVADCFAVVGLIITLMVTNIFPWKYPPFSILSVMQFSFRLLIFPSLLFAIAGAIYVVKLKVGNMAQFVILIGILILTTIMLKGEGRNYIIQGNRDYEEYVEYTLGNTNYMAYGKCEYLPDGVPSIKYLIFNAKMKSKYNDTVIDQMVKEKDIISFRVTTDRRDEVIETPVVYYKGYVASIDGKDVELRQSKLGMIELPIDQSGTASIHYAGTVIQKVSTAISLISIMVLCIFIYISKRKHKKDNTYA